jgi:hypothetical protein
MEFGDEVQGAYGKGSTQFKTGHQHSVHWYQMSIANRVRSALCPVWRSAIASRAWSADGGGAARSAVGCDALRCMSTVCVDPPIPPGNVALVPHARGFYTSRKRLAISQNTAMDIFDRCLSALSLAPCVCKCPSPLTSRSSHLAGAQGLEATTQGPSGAAAGSQRPAAGVPLSRVCDAVVPGAACVQSLMS